jgi:hypothetical protein
MSYLETQYGSDVVIVSGDWLLTGDGDPGIGYEACVASWWNGWAVPAMRRNVVERMIADDERINEEAGVPVADRNRFSWDGDTLVFRGIGDESDTRVEPLIDGRYVLDFGWCWDVYEEDAHQFRDGVAAEAAECVECGRPVVYDYDVEDYRHTEAGVACALADAPEAPHGS